MCVDDLIKASMQPLVLGEQPKTMQYFTMRMSLDVEGKMLENKEKSWLAFFSVISLITHCCGAMFPAIVGPTQVYVATKSLGVVPTDLNVQWSFSAGGWLVGSVVSSAVFKRFIVDPRIKEGWRCRLLWP